jgi:hypothetical protein
VEHLKTINLAVIGILMIKNFRKEDLESEKNHQKSKNIKCGFEERNGM